MTEELKALIDELSLLRIAHEISLEYDCVPEDESIEKIIEIFDFNEDQIKQVIDNYIGWSPRDLRDLIETTVFKISKLK